MAGDQAYQAARVKQKQVDDWSAKVQALNQRADEMDNEAADLEKQAAEHELKAGSQGSDSPAERAAAAQMQASAQELRTAANNNRKAAQDLDHEVHAAIQDISRLKELARSAEEAEGRANDAARRALS